MSAIWWIRRDLRLGDNQALQAAIVHGQTVLPVFVLDDKLLNSAWTGEKRKAFMFAGLRSLDAELQKRGARLIVRRGDPVEVLQELVDKAQAVRVFAEQDFSPYAQRRDRRVAESVPLRLTGGLTVHPPGTIRKKDGNPYTVFTPFSWAWRDEPFPGKPQPAPEWLPMMAGAPAGELLPEQAGGRSGQAFPVGEAEAQQRLERFLQERMAGYGGGRNRMDLEGTSGLSPYLRWGMISARQAAWAVRQAELAAAEAGERQGAETWLNELIWREFYIAILAHFPHVRKQAFREKMRNIAWLNEAEALQAWADGRTGYPVVDAGMRQLRETGWMHNRARMITASFLTKDLLVDWRLGEKHFMQHLLDGDPAANNGGWQWSAGTGTDAAPYFRVFNPVHQGIKFDPQGDYVRRYVPELMKVPTAYIHEPWKMPAEVEKISGCTVGKDYPLPIVEHTEARKRVLMVYKSMDEQ